MDRRTFIGAVAAGIITAPLAASAQTATTVRRIGVLSLDARPTPALLQQIYAPLSELGWTEGKNLLIERRYANGRAELLRPFAEELVRLKVEIIVTSGTDATLAAKNATTSIPIVMYSAGDPVRAGLVASLARPGGNITGFPLLARSLTQSVFLCCANCCRACSASACWRMRPIRTGAPYAKSSSRCADHLACSRSLSKSPRQASWRMRSRSWLAGERRRYLCKGITYSSRIEFQL